MADTASPPPLRAVLFDIDGTLVDSNYLHIDAWMRAFSDAGREVSAFEVHQGIGLDSKMLLERLVGDDAESAGDELKDRHSHYYEESASRLRCFAGVRELFEALQARGLEVVLASSAPEDELKILLDVLQVEDLIGDATDSSDVETAKPEPDVIARALEKAGVSADEAIMIGDARWDVEAAARAGVPAIGVLTGGRGRAELLEAGAIEVYDDVAALLAGLEDSAIGQRIPER